jgi:putative membrane protein
MFLIYFLLSILLKAVTFWAIGAKVFPGSFVVEGGEIAYIILAVVFTIFNSFLKPILNIITLPIRLLTLGLSSLALNALLLWGTEIVVNFLAISNVAVHITGWSVYLIAGFILAMISSLLHWFFK